MPPDFQYQLPFAKINAPIWLKAVLLTLILAFIFFGLFFSAPAQFPVNDMVNIPEGVSVETAGQILENRKIVRSKSTFTILTTIFGDGHIQAGGYLFDRRENVYEVAMRLTMGKHNLQSVKITFPEGTTVAEMAELCTKYLKECSKDEFIKISLPIEGYLFPDTYFFWENADAEIVISMMSATHKQKIATLDKEIRLFGKPVEQVVIMASILEKEARKYEDMQKVSSVLWKRIELGMPLQVDATLDYALNKNTYELTLKDLATTSPFNTYKYKGLPPAPIANPGIDSLRAAISPTPTKYLYYLTDRSGNFYYAENHDKHLVNKRRYINQ